MKITMREIDAYLLGLLIGIALYISEWGLLERIVFAVIGIYFAARFLWYSYDHRR